VDAGFARAVSSKLATTHSRSPRGKCAWLVQGARQVPPRGGARLPLVATPVMHLAGSRPAAKHPPRRTTPRDFVAPVLKRTRTLCSQAYFRSPVRFPPGFGGTSSQGPEGTACIPDRVRGQAARRVRKVLCQATWARVRHDPEEKAAYERIKAKNPKKKKIAVVASMRRLAVRMWHRGRMTTESAACGISATG